MNSYDWRFNWSLARVIGYEKNKKITPEIIEENKRLIREYPFLAVGGNGDQRPPSEQDFKVTWLDCMPIGWRKVFGEEMCREIKDVLIENNLLDDYWVIQIKEKFGSLRWYDNKNPKCTWDIIRKYVELSKHTCFECGAEGTMRENLNWISPHCDKCYEKLIKERPLLLRDKKES